MFLMTDLLGSQFLARFRGKLRGLRRSSLRLGAFGRRSSLWSRCDLWCRSALYGLGKGDTLGKGHQSRHVQTQKQSKDG